MKQLNVFYRALLDYRAQTLKDRVSTAQRSAIAQANADSDRIVLTRKFCIINEDWVDAIEEGLTFIDKAIKEDRQFIRSNGEVVPIEKVKNVSKASVEHLAKHSNLITRQVEGEDLIPDQLYTVEKLNDYAVYENRFLYMLLCYLQDFITLRYNKILELSNTYNGTMTMSKTVKMAKEQIRYDVQLTDIRRDDAYLREHNEAKEIIDRIDLLLKAVLSLLSTPLMEMVAKAPMLKPPITKTNVLKMNNNFKQAMALYAFVTSYEGDGYSVETQVKEMNPFRDDIADEMAETVLLSSFLVYEHSLGLESFLKKAYDKEEQERKEAEYQRFLEKLEATRLRLRNSEISPEEYILMLESNVRQLEKRCESLVRTRQELERTQELLETANAQIRQLTKTLEDTCRQLEEEKQRRIQELAAMKEAYEAELEAMRVSHAEEIENLNAAHAGEIESLNTAHAEEIESLNAEHAQEIDSLNSAHAEEMDSLRQAHEQALCEQQEAHEKEVLQLCEDHSERVRVIQEERAAELTQVRTEAENARTALLSEYATYREEANARQEEFQTKLDIERSVSASLMEQRQALEDQVTLVKAELEAMRRARGKAPEVDYSTREGFAELERMYELFTALYKEQWKKTKRRIRKDLLKPEKMAKKAAKQMANAERKQNRFSATATKQAPTPNQKDQGK